MPQFVKDTGLITFTRILSRLFSLLATIVLARFLGPDGNGHYTLAFLLSSTAVALLNFGLSPTAVYFIARGEHPREQIVTHLLFINTLVSGVAVVVGWLILVYFKPLLFPHTPLRYLLLGLLIIPGVFFFRLFQSVLLGLQRFEFYNFGQILWSLGHFLFIGLAVGLFSGGVSGAILAEAFSWIAGAFLLLYWIRKVIPRWVFRFNPRMTRSMLTYGVHSYLGNLLAFFNYRADLFLLNFFQGPAAVGVYSVAVGLAERLWLISQTASTVLLPRVSASNDAAWRRRFTPLITRTVFLLVFPLALILGLFARPVIHLLYSSAFLDAARPLQILLIGIVAFSLSSVLAQDIAGRGYPLLNTYTSALALAVNVGVNLVAIPRWGIRGAALASAISYSALLLSKLFFYYRLSGNSWKEVVLSKREDWVLYRHTILHILRYFRQSPLYPFRKDRS